MTTREELPLESAATPKTKTVLWASSATVIPRNYLGHVTVRTDFRSSALYIEGGIRTEGQVIPRCVITTDDEGKAVILVLNLSDRAFELPEGGTVTRGEKCVEGIQTRGVNEELVIADEIDTDLTGVENHSLLNLINECKDLVSRTLKQVGCTDKAQMQIELSDDSPVCYRPYRLSFHHRGPEGIRHH